MEALILRRNYPVPVTFANLRLAYCITGDGMCDADVMDWEDAETTTQEMIDDDTDRRWTAALKQATGATDDVYAVVDGREVHVARASRGGFEWTGSMTPHTTRPAIENLLEVADEAGYWERPHEVRLNLQERIPTKRAIGKVVERSIFEAGVRRGN